MSFSLPNIRLLQFTNLQTLHVLFLSVFIMNPPEIPLRGGGSHLEFFLLNVPSSNFIGSNTSGQQAI